MTDPDFFPSTIEEAVNHIVKNIEPEEVGYIKSQSSASVHFFGGMAMRNDWSLWEPDTPLKRDAIATYKIAHADDISGLIMDWVWAKVRGEEFDPVKACDIYHKHWAAYGMTSIEAGTPQS